MACSLYNYNQGCMANRVVPFFLQINMFSSAVILRGGTYSFFRVSRGEEAGEGGWTCVSKQFQSGFEPLIPSSASSVVSRTSPTVVFHS